MEKFNGVLYLNVQDLIELFADRKPISKKVKKVKNKKKLNRKKKAASYSTQFSFNFAYTSIEKLES